MRVLIVEDERALADLVATAIREAGFAADVARDGREGLRLGLAAGYDAVVLDLLLPGLHGLAVLRELRRAKPSLPILVLTALDETAEKIEGLDRGADDYVTKPFDLEELLARLRAAAARSGSRPASTRSSPSSAAGRARSSRATRSASASSTATSRPLRT